jgi:HSP20 family molecular chaperone IbpA
MTEFLQKTVGNIKSAGTETMHRLQEAFHKSPHHDQSVWDIKQSELEACLEPAKKGLTDQWTLPYNNMKWSPEISCDIVECPDGIQFSFDVPGVEADCISSRVEFDDEHGKILRVIVNKPLLPLETGTHFLRKEHAYGTAHRSFRLDESIDVSRMKATLCHGVLRVFVPKKSRGMISQTEGGLSQRPVSVSGESGLPQERGVSSLSGESSLSKERGATPSSGESGITSERFVCPSTAESGLASERRLGESGLTSERRQGGQSGEGGIAITPEVIAQQQMGSGSAPRCKPGTCCTDAGH